MNDFLKDGVKTQDLLREFFPDEQWGTEEANAPSSSSPVAGDNRVPVPSPDPQVRHPEPATRFGDWQVVADVQGSAVDRNEPWTPSPRNPDRSRRTARLLVPLLVLFGIAAVGGAGYVVGNRFLSSDSNESAAAQQEGTAAGSEVAGGQEASVDSGGAEVAVAGSGEGAASEAEPLYDAPEVSEDASMDFEVDGTDALGRPLPALPAEPIPNTADALNLPGYHPDPLDAPATGPYTVVHGGRFYLRGTVSSENLRQELIRRNLLILPLEVLVIEYEIDAEEPWYLDGVYPIFLEDSVLFASGSDEVDELFIPLFELGANLLALDPNMGMRITGHTDARGDRRFNLDLSQQRADAVRAQYLAFGAGENQVIAVGKGEAEPIASNSTAAGRQANRRVEFQLFSFEAAEPMAAEG